MPLGDGRFSIGIDVGGTKILGAVVDTATGRVIEVQRIETAAHLGGAAVLDRCMMLARRLRARPGLDDAPIGIALCEVVDPAGAPISAATVDWIGLDVCGAFREGVPVVIESDVRAAAIAEARFGAGADVEQFVYVTVGTGIAHTLVIGGVPHRGHRGAAILLGAPPVERVSSGTAIASRSGLPNAEAAFSDDAAAPVIADAARRLGTALAWLSLAVDPERIVVGGGLGLRTDYREAATTAMIKAVTDAGGQPVEVLPARLGPASAAIGAAIVATTA